MHTTNRVPSGDAEIFYRLFGATQVATPALALHGLSYFSWDWIPIGERLGQDRPFAAMDMRGFGESGWSASKDYGMAANARDILAVLDRLGWKRAALVGHSMGGRNAAWCAAENPDRIAAVVLVDYTPSNAPEGSKRVVASVAGVPDRFASIDDALRHFKSENRARFEAYLKPVEGGFAIKRDGFFHDQFRRIRDTGERPPLPVDMWTVLGRIACPVLVVRGRQSDLFGAESVERMRAMARPNLTLVEVEGGHDIPGQNPEALVREVGAFLKQVEATS